MIREILSRLRVKGVLDCCNRNLLRRPKFVYACVCVCVFLLLIPFLLLLYRICDINIVTTPGYNNFIHLIYILLFDITQISC